MALRARLLGAFAVLAFSLIACNSDQSSPNPVDHLTPEDAHWRLAGNTVMTFADTYELCTTPAVCLDGDCLHCTTQPGPGTLVEYFAENGQSFLWQPASDVIALNDWRLERWNGRYDLCFLRPRKGNDPYLRDKTDGSQCFLLSYYADSIAETIEGDPFELAGRRLPFVLARERTTLRDLLQRRLSQ